MSIKKISMFIVVLFTILAGIRFMFVLKDIVDGSWGNNKCYDDCLSPELVIENSCSIDDNNCKGGNHYCYDLCYGVAVWVNEKKAKVETEEVL